MLVLRTCLLALAAWLLGSCAQVKPPSRVPAWSLMPQPAHMQPAARGAVRVGDGAIIAVPANDPAATAIAEDLARLVARTRGLHLRVRTGRVTGAVLELRLSARAPVHGNEGYRIRIGQGRIRVEARAPQGLYYGMVTLWQLLTPIPGGSGPVEVANGSIDDHPRFAWRGLLLDSARHFQSVSDIRKLIDWMSLHKLDVLHWHLTDDQGWRLQIKRYPLLTRIGACRRAVGADAALTGGPDKPYCGFYTQAQVRDLVRYAERHYVTIVPEIEMPGHAQAAIASYPDLGVTGERPPVSTDWGVNTWLYAPDEHSIRFLEDVLDEVMALFPSTYIHVGGDEAAKDQWQASAAVQAKLRKLHLANDNALQGWMIEHIGTYLQAHHRRLIGWDEILDGPLPAHAAVMSWHGVSGAIKAADMGHDAVLSPAPTLYLDHLQGDARDEPAGRPQVESLQDIYDFDPLPAGIPPRQAVHVLGAQANLWTEYMPTFARDQHAIFPRIAALAEVTWSPQGTRDWKQFLARMPAQLARYRALGIHVADSAWEPRFHLSRTANGDIAVALDNQSGDGTIRYTTDGSVPTAGSRAYLGPLAFASVPATRLRAATFTRDGYPLAAPRSRTIDTATLLTRRSNQLDPCTHKIVLRIEDDRPLRGKRPFYQMDIDNMCWIWHQAPLDSMHRIEVTVGNLPWRYALWKGITGVVKRPTRTPYGSIEVHLDTCDGPLLARMPLAPAAAVKTQTTLHAGLHGLHGTHDLCVFATGDPMHGLWAVGQVKLSP